MIRCTDVYVTQVQRNIGVMSVAPLYRQDHSAHLAAKKIQDMWRSKVHAMEPFGGHIGGAFDSWYGYYPNLCATKIQAIVRGHQARVHLPMVRMTRWIVDNLLCRD